MPRTLIAGDLASGRLVEAAPEDRQLEPEIRPHRGRSTLGQAAESFWPAVCAAAP